MIFSPCAAPLREAFAQDAGIGAIGFDQRLARVHGPAQAALRIEIQVLCDQRVELVAVLARKIGEGFQEELIGDRLDDQVQADEGLVPVEGQQ